MKRKILHLVVREDLQSPLLQTQLLNVISAKEMQTEVQSLLCWFCRFDKYVLEYKQNALLKKKLKGDGVKLITIPFLAGKFPLKYIGLILFMITVIPALLIVVSALKPHIVHARSYNSALAAALASRIFNFKLIFDPRSDFLEENIVAGAWANDNLIYKIWLRFEQFILLQSHHVVLTASRLIDRKRLKGTAEISIVPNCYNKTIRDGVRPLEKKFDFVYCGSISGWNALDSYAKFIRKMNRLQPNYRYRFLFDSKSFNKMKKSKLPKELLSDNVIIETRDPCDVGSALRECRYGLYLLEGGVDGRLGVKMVEYVSQGLPVIFSSNLISLCDLNKHCHFGLEFRADTDPAELYALIEDDKFYTNVSKNALKLSKEFSLSNVIKLYHKLYKSVQ